MFNELIKEYHRLVPNEPYFNLTKIFGCPLNKVLEILNVKIYIIEGKLLKIYDEDTGKIVKRENSDGFWVKMEYDDNGNQIYEEHSNGHWYRWGYDDNGNEIYWENPHGIIPRITGE